MSIRQYVISDPANIAYKQSQKDITGTPSTVWQQQMVEACTQTQNIIHSDHPYLYRRNNLTKDSETHFRPLQTVEDYNPQYYDPEYGKDPYWDDDLYDKHNLQFRNDDYPPTDDEDHPDIVDTILSRALKPWQPNFDAIKDQPHAEETQATPGLLDETAFIHVLVTKEGEPAYIPLSTNLGLNYKKRMLYFPMDFGDSNHRRPHRHWSSLQRNTGSRPQENTPTGAPIHSQRGTCPDVSNYGRKRTIGNRKEHC